MDRADEQGAQRQPAAPRGEHTEETPRRVDVGMRVDVSAVDVRVAVHGLEMPVVVVGGEMRRRNRVEPPRGVAESQRAEQDQHRGDEQLEAARDAGPEREPPADDQRARQGEGHHVADAPEHADQRAVGEARLPRDDRGDGDEMVGVGRVLEAEDEAEENGREDRVH